jgi:uncharacterized phage protein gp47/JayE
VSFTPRQYDQIVRDVLTTLTGGTVRESLKAPAADTPVTPAKLRDRPVRRISSLEGTIEAGAGRTVPYRFTSADFELISTTGDDGGKDAIRFRETGRKPVPGSDLTVNYYPVETRPVPVNDLTPGSVLRTLLETVSLEMALMYQQLGVIYDSAFLETAEGRSLDKVVALVGVRRLGAGHPIVKVRFFRRAATPGRITVPAGTALTDAAGNRYLTNEELALEPGESTRDTLAAGESPGTAEVDTGKLDRMEVLVAGIDKVTNLEPARRASQAETDDELRRRARGAFQGVARGTVASLRFHLLSLPEVKDVAITEEPNGVPGEIKVEVAYFNDTPDARQRVDERILQVRPAGVRVMPVSAARRPVHVRVALTLAGTGVSGPEFSALRSSIEAKLTKALNDTPPGGTVRRSRLAAIAVEDPRVVDGKVFITPESGAEVDELALNPGEVLDVVQPVQFSTPSTEVSVTTRVDVKVSAMLPIHLTPGTTALQATNSIENALISHLATRAADAPLTLDSVAAAIRDDSRFALVRKDAAVTVESGTRFFQLTDMTGSYAPAPNETLRKDRVDVQLREGGV